MTLELWMLLGSSMLLFVLVMLQQLHVDLTLGPKYALSNREEPKPDTGISGRIDRAILNLRENLLLFAPVVLVLAIVEISNGITQNGAIVFFVARIVHAFTYVIGITGVRSLAWFAGIVGIGMMLSAVF
ncbi:MAG: MAPEG family protein [Cyanobacteria bacterium J06636_27]